MHMKSIRKYTAIFLGIACIVMILPVSVIAENVAAKTFITSLTLDGSRNDQADTKKVKEGWGGIQITVGSEDMIVTSVGRMQFDGSAATHNFLIINAEDSSLVASNISVTNKNTKSGEYLYATLQKPVTLSSGKSYYIASDFIGDTDKFYDHSTAQTLKDASLDGTVMLDVASGAWNSSKNANICLGPVNFTYYLAGEYASLPTVKTDNSSKETTTTKGAIPELSEKRSIKEILGKEEITPFVKSCFLNGNRNITTGDAGNYAGWVGIKVTVGDRPIIVTAMGRITGPGSDATHNMIIVEIKTNTVVIDSVKVIRGKVGEIAYADLPKPIVLQANTSYYMATDVMSWSDQWYDATTVTTSSVAKIDGCVLMGLKDWETFQIPGVSWGPVSFKYVAMDEPTTVAKTTAATDIQQTESTDAVDSETSQAGGPSHNYIPFIILGIVVIAGATGAVIYILRKKKVVK